MLKRKPRAGQTDWAPSTGRRVSPLLQASRPLTPEQALRLAKFALAYLH
ncbi:MAG: hypothetical protein JOZ39_04845 [Chloroflexi bacterium]|nr:hypothetical protein [Chloroflexota bacterium]